MTEGKINKSDGYVDVSGKIRTTSRPVLEVKHHADCMLDKNLDLRTFQSNGNFYI
jgi:hypothetical protein